MKKLTRIALGLFALSSPVIAEGPIENKIINNSKFDQTSPELHGIHFTSKPETIQLENGEIYSIDITKTKNGEIYSVGTDSKYLLIQYILKHNDGDSKYHSVDFDGDGRRDYVIIAKDGTKYVYFSFECPCDPCDDQTWYVFPKDEEVIKPYYE